MPVPCLPVPRPWPRLYPVIIIVICLFLIRLDPQDTLPRARGTARGGLLTLSPGCGGETAGVPGGAR